jgi:tRNA pseudouridine38-40 synthase
MKIAACVEYDGTAYCGWQRLKHAASVQEEVEKALSYIANESIAVVCAGRTDSGVHGLGQIIHFETQAQRSHHSWLMGTNTRLPDDIALSWVHTVTDDFHARFSALSRYYRYIILNRNSRSALLHQQVCWHRPPLDAKRMHQAAQALIGEQDFSSFRASACQAPHARRNMQAINVQRQGEFIYIDIQANAFLHHMVRNIVGSLLIIGQGKQATDWLAYLLKHKDRTLAAATAPASGLYFVQVEYPEKFALPISHRIPSFS